MTNLTNRPEVVEVGHLLPCPFCGGEPMPDFCSDFGAEAYFVHCQQADCPVGPSAQGNTEAEAIAGWNRRSAIAPFVERAVKDAVKPWANFHGDLPDYDHPLRCVFESGIQYTVDLLAKMLKVDDYEVCDGTEEFDGDLGGTLINIVLAAMPSDEHGDPIYPSELPQFLTDPTDERAQIVAWLRTRGYPGSWLRGSCGELATAIEKGEHAMQADIPKGWIAHDGGPCPVAPETIVWFMLRTGGVDKWPAKKLNWRYGTPIWEMGGTPMPPECDIIAYKPETPDA